MDDIEGCGKIALIVGFVASVIGIFTLVAGIVGIHDWLGKSGSPD